MTEPLLIEDEPDSDQSSSDQDETIQQARKKKLLKLVGHEQLKQIMPLIREAIGGPEAQVTIYDKDGEVVATATNEDQAIEQLLDRLKASSEKGKELGEALVNENNGDFVMIRLKEDQNLPTLIPKLLKLDQKLNLSIEEENEIHYRIQDMIRKGFTSGDMRELAMEILQKQRNRGDSIPKNAFRKAGPKKIKSKTYSLNEIEAMKNFTRKAGPRVKKVKSPINKFESQYL